MVLAGGNSGVTAQRLSEWKWGFLLLSANLCIFSALVSSLVRCFISRCMNRSEAHTECKHWRCQAVQISTIAFSSWGTLSSVSEVKYNLKCVVKRVERLSGFHCISLHTEKDPAMYDSIEQVNISIYVSILLYIVRYYVSILLYIVNIMSARLMGISPEIR